MSDTTNEPPVLLIGANIRFLAENAVRHLHKIFTVDHYGDWDLRNIAPGKSTRRDGGKMDLDSLIRLAEGRDYSGVVYGPGFENDLAALAKLKTLGDVLGCSTETTRRVRDPESLRRSAASWNFSYPPLEFRKIRAAQNGLWLEKPLEGMGGDGIGYLNPDSESAEGNVYYQAYVNGLSSSASVVSNGSDATVLGVMTQIIGDKSFGASGFRFVGNIFPNPFEREIIEQVTALADSLTLEYDLKGLWGFDFVYNGDVILIEVNSRPSAGMGLLDIATWNDLLGMHMDSVTGKNSNIIIDPGPRGRYFAQARVFAKDDAAFTGSEKWHERGARDIPFDGDFIRAGEPVLTVTASDKSYNGAMEKLRKEAELVYSSLSSAPVAQSL